MPLFYCVSLFATTYGTFYVTCNLLYLFCCDHVISSCVLSLPYLPSHWSVFQRVQLTISHHCFMLWLGAEQATSHYLKQWWPDSLTHICGIMWRWDKCVVCIHRSYGYHYFVCPEHNVALTNRCLLNKPKMSFPVLSLRSTYAQWIDLSHILANVILFQLKLEYTDKLEDWYVMQLFHEERILLPGAPFTNMP